MYASLWSRATNVQFYRELLRSGDLAKVGIYALEAYGIFKVGRNLVRSKKRADYSCIDWRDHWPEKSHRVQHPIDSLHPFPLNM